MNRHEQLHERACTAARNYLRAEYELIEVIDEVDRGRFFVRLGFSSMFAYCVEALKLSESVALNCINVARKSRTIPALKDQIRAGALTVSKARKIVSVLTPENQGVWLAKAASLTSRRLEKEVARENPRAAVPEKASYVSGQRLALQLGVDERVMLNFRRAQDLVSQSTGRPATLEETLERMLAVFLDARDPIRRAKRVIAKKGNTAAKNADVPGTVAATAEPPTAANLSAPTATIPAPNEAIRAPMHFSRTPIPAAVLHQLRLRDGGRCAHIDAATGKRCTSRRWLHSHHLRPVAQGGPNTLENLTTLCAVHHAFTHARGSG